MPQGTLPSCVAALRQAHRIVAAADLSASLDSTGSHATPPTPHEATLTLSLQQHHTPPDDPQPISHPPRLEGCIDAVFRGWGLSAIAVGVVKVPHTPPQPPPPHRRGLWAAAEAHRAQAAAGEGHRGAPPPACPCLALLEGMLSGARHDPTATAVGTLLSIAGAALQPPPPPHPTALTLLAEACDEARQARRRGSGEAPPAGAAGLSTAPSAEPQPHLSHWVLFRRGGVGRGGDAAADESPDILCVLSDSPGEMLPAAAPPAVELCEGVSVRADPLSLRHAKLLAPQLLQALQGAPCEGGGNEANPPTRRPLLTIGARLSPAGGSSNAMPALIASLAAGCAVRSPCWGGVVPGIASCAVAGSAPDAVFFETAVEGLRSAGLLKCVRTEVCPVERQQQGGEEGACPAPSEQEWLGELYLALCRGGGGESLAEIESDILETQRAALRDYPGTARLVGQLNAELERKRKEVEEQAEHIRKHDAALALFEKHMHGVTERESLLEEVAAQQRKVDGLQQQLDEAFGSNSGLRRGFEEVNRSHAEDKARLEASLAEVANVSHIRQDEIVHLGGLVEGLLHEKRGLEAQATRSQHGYIADTTRLAAELRAAHDTHLVERAARIESEKSLKELRLAYDNDTALLKAEVHKLKLTVSYDSKRALSKAVQLQQERDVLSQRLAEANESAESLRRGETGRRAKHEASVGVEVHVLNHKLQDMQRALDERTEAFESVSAELRLKSQRLEESQAQLREKEGQYLREAVKYNACTASHAVGVGMLEKEIEECNRINESKTRLLQSAVKEHMQEMQKVAAQHRDGLSMMQTNIETLEKRNEEQGVEVSRLAQLQQDTEDALTQERAAHGTTREQLAKAKEEGERLEGLSASINENFHFRIQQDQLRRKAEEITHLCNKVRGLEAQLQGAAVDSAVLAGSRPLGEGNLRTKLDIAETGRLGAESALKQVLSELQHPPNQQRFDPAAPLLHCLPHALQRDLALLVNPETTRHIRESNWVGSDGITAPHSKPLLEPLPAKAGESTSFAGLPQAVPGTVASSRYISHQRSKLVPSIYDLDW